MITVVHMSDWHGRQGALPAADLYLCTGDMLPNSRFCQIDDQLEAQWQAAWIRTHPFTPFIANPAAPLVCLRGNHDYTDLAPYFPGMDVHEFHEPGETIERLGLTIGGCRGIQRINKSKRGSAFWQDEYWLSELDDRMRALPGGLDIVMTHCGPYGVMSAVGFEETGSPALTAYLQREQPPLACWGHIHEQHGIEVRGATTCSNAATTWHLFHLGPDRVELCEDELSDS